jgi:hypothetical protein
MVIATIAEERTTKIPYLGWRFHPARSFPIEFSNRLQFSILLFREYLNTYRGRHFDSAPAWFVLLS